MNAKDTTTPSFSVADPTTVEGAVPFDLGPDCRAGLRGTRDDLALLTVTRTGAGERLHGTVGHKLRKGNLLAACGKFFRIVEVKQTDEIVYDRKPVPAPTGISFRSDTLVMPAGGDAVMGDLILDVVSIESQKGKPVAELKLGIKKGTGFEATATYKTITVAAGDALGEATKYRVLSVVAPDPSRGIPGWVEVDTKAQ